MHLAVMILLCLSISQCIELQEIHFKKTATFSLLSVADVDSQEIRYKTKHTSLSSMGKCVELQEIVVRMGCTSNLIKFSRGGGLTAPITTPRATLNT
jgi:hypothetical protein